MKKIDAHLHVAEVIAGYCRRGELRACGDGKAIWGNGEVFQLLPKGYGDKSFTAESALDLMDENRVEKAVLMQGSMYGFQNEYHYQLLQKYPDRFCPSCTTDPFMTNALEIIKFYIEERKFRLVKFEVSSGGGLMGCHKPFLLNSDRMMKIYEVINHNHGILAMDVGDISMQSYQPDSLARIASAFPDLKLVVCHLLAPLRGKERELWASLELLSKKNVWFDLAALPKIMAPDVYPYLETHKILSEAKQIVGSDRLLWGTDAPYAATQDTYGHLADYLEHDHTFTEKELEDIYYHNANRVYFGS